MTNSSSGLSPRPPDAGDFDPALDEYQGITWEERAKRSGRLGSALDPADIKGRKNRYIDRLQRRALRTILTSEVGSRGRRFEHGLDYGCGGGRLTTELAPYCGEVSGIDPSAEMIALARALPDAGQARFVHWRKGPIPFDDGYFDLFLSVGVTLKIPVLDHAAAHLPRVCASGATGILIEQVDARRGLTLERYATTLASAGFEIVTAVPIRRSIRSPFQRLATLADWPRWILGALARSEIAVMRWRHPTRVSGGFLDYAITVRRTAD